MNHTTIGITLIVTTIAIVEVNIAQIQQQRPQSQSPRELSGGNLYPVAVNGYSTTTIQPTPILKVSKGDAHYPSPQEKSTIDRTINQTLSMAKLLERIINESHTCTSEAILCEYNNINNTIAFKL
jgi:hypothetical protein